MNRSLLMLSLICLIWNHATAQCDAGANAAVTLCSNGNAVDLLDLLNGSPMTSGSWIDAADVAIPDTFDPAVGFSGVYRYVVSMDENGVLCALNDTAFLTLNISAVPIVSFTVNNSSGCGSLSAQFNNTTVAPGYTTCIWDFGNGGASTVCSPIHNYQNIGVYDVSLSISNGIGCQSTGTEPAMITVLNSPEAAFSMEESPIPSTTGVGRFINESIGANTYEWIIPLVGNYTDLDPVVTFPPEEASYFVCLEANALNGCSDTYCATVFVRDETIIYVPSAFTPNLDNVNDFFRPKLTFEPQLYEFQVFDRWGNMIFESKDPALGWNGASDSGEFFSPDNYYAWKIKAVKDATIINRMGKVLMLR